MILFAHHVELQHVPVLVLLFAVGGYLGWHVVSLLLRYLRPSPSALPEGDGKPPMR